MTDYFGAADLPADTAEQLRSIARRYIGFIPGITADGIIPNAETALAVLEFQRFESDIQDAHIAWLRRTRARFERNGWPWTPAELARRSRLREVGE